MRLGEHHELEIVAYTFVAALTASTAIAAGYERLTQNDVRFYGRIKKSDKTKFVTCNAGEVDIVNGKVEPTDKECGGTPIVGPINGNVYKLDPIGKLLILQDRGGNVITFHLTTEEMAVLRNIDVGSAITVNGTGKGRAIDAPAVDKMRDRLNDAAVQPKLTTYSGLYLNKGVVRHYPQLERELGERGLKASAFGQPYEAPNTLVVAFGPDASLADLRKVVESIGESESLFLAPIADDSYKTAIIIGAERGDGHIFASSNDIRGALANAETIQDVIAAISKKAKLR